MEEVTGWSVEDFHSACGELSESEPLHSEVSTSSYHEPESRARGIDGTKRSKHSGGAQAQLAVF